MLLLKQAMWWKSQHNDDGFSLLELLVVISVITSLSSVLVLNFRASATNRTARNQVASVIISDVRRAQSLALAGSAYHGNITCGYGVHYLNNSSYVLFAVTDSNADDLCAGEFNGYGAGSVIIETRTLTNPSIVFQSPFSDIYFSLPFAQGYIGTIPSPAPSADITLKAVDEADCVSSACTVVNVYSTGQIDTQNAL